MAVRFLPNNEVGSWIDSFIKSYEVKAPVKTGNSLSFQSVDKGSSISLDYELPAVPPKGTFFPQTEVMMKYQTQPNLEITRQSAPTTPSVLFGVRGCDLKSFKLLDKVFLNGLFVDTFYRDKRDNTVIVALGCPYAKTTCFCNSFGVDPTAPDGADIVLFPIEGGYTVEIRTDKGQELISKSGFRFKEAAASQEKAADEAKKNALLSFTLKVDPAGVSETLEGMFESQLWSDMSHKCLGCGVCSYVCPTCHCFDIQDEAKGNNGQRLRCWDNCMFSDFTRMAGGHNPRPSKRERVRQRFMHKLRYYPVNNGDYACVGCGRCLAKCPAGMDITEVIEEVKASV